MIRFIATRSQEQGTDKNANEKFDNPGKMERALKRGAQKKFGTTKSKRARAYIYGTMRSTGWKPGK